MKNTLRTYSQILQLRGDTIQTLLQTDRGIAFSIKLFLVVSLIAGLGLWFGIPAALRTPTAVERFDTVIAEAREAVATAVAAVESATAAAQGRIETAITTASEEFDRRFGGTLRQIEEIAGRFASPEMRLSQLLDQATVTAGEIEAVVQQAKPTPEQMGKLLARAKVSEAEAARLLEVAGLTQDEVDAARAAQQQQLDAAMAELQPMLESIQMSRSQFQELIGQVSATPEQVVEWIKALSTTPEQIGAILAAIQATPERLNQLVANVRAELVKMEPPVGERPARIVRLAGGWLASPLHYAASWMLFVLASLLVAKSLGGRATLNQHFAAFALSAAPALLFLFAYAPDMSGAVALPTAIAIHYTGRILALLGLLWCAALLLKTISVAHGFGMWKSAGALVLTWAALYVIAPLAVVLATTFLVG